MTTRRAVAIWTFTLGVVVAACVLVFTSDHVENPAATAVFACAAGIAFVTAGLIAWVRRPRNGSGKLMTLVGLTSFFGVLAVANDSTLFTIGLALGSIVFALFLHFVLAFPSGRLEGAAARAAVIGAWTLATLGQLVDPARDAELGLLRRGIHLPVEPPARGGLGHRRGDPGLARPDRQDRRRGDGDHDPLAPLRQRLARAAAHPGPGLPHLDDRDRLAAARLRRALAVGHARRRPRVGDGRRPAVRAARVAPRPARAEALARGRERARRRDRARPRPGRDRVVAAARPPRPDADAGALGRGARRVRRPRRHAGRLPPTRTACARRRSWSAAASRSRR